jgi:DNA-binding IclR family transcriptional regulator
MATMKTVRSVERAVSILFCISDSAEPLGLSELGRSVGLDKATTLRLVATLEKQGLVRKEERTRRYILGPSIARLINSLHTDVRQLCRPHMERLVEATGEAVCLDIPRGFERVVAEAVDAQYELCVSPKIGSAVPIYVGASGKAIMAYMNEEDVERIIAATKLKPMTKDSITDPDRLRGQFKKIRQQGYAISHGETLRGGASVAAPVFKRGGQIVGALDIRGPQLRLDKVKLNQLAPIVKKCAADISRELGFEDLLIKAE